MTRYTVIATHRSAYEGLDPSMPERPREVHRSNHRTYLGADYFRRFRFSYPTMGFRWIETRIDPRDVQGRFRPYPRYRPVLERFVWPVAYFLRNRWDGLRYGRDRDSRW